MFLLPECVEPGEVAELDELERGTAAGTHVVDLPVESEAPQRGCAVTPADNSATLREEFKTHVGTIKAVLTLAETMPGFPEAATTLVQAIPIPRPLNTV